MTSAIGLNASRNSGLPNYQILTFAAALAIHTLGNTSPGSMDTPRSMFYHPTLAVAVFISHGGVHAMNNVIRSNKMVYSTKY